MKILCAVLLSITVASTAGAKEVFTNKDLKEIKIVEIRDNRAVVQNSDKTKIEVKVGDSLGKDSGTVVELEKNAVVVEHGNTRTRMRLYPGMVREVSVPR